MPPRKRKKKAAAAAKQEEGEELVEEAGHHELIPEEVHQQDGEDGGGGAPDQPVVLSFSLMDLLSLLTDVLQHQVEVRIRRRCCLLGKYSADWHGKSGTGVIIVLVKNYGRSGQRDGSAGFASAWGGCHRFNR